MSNAVSTTWPSGSANGGWPQEPTGMLMPGRIQGWPAGTQRASSPATTLLSQAVAWWDVEQYRDGDRFLRNRGVAGELLDLRLGSSIVANSNDPQYLAPQDQGYVYLPGVASNRLSVPDEAAFAISGDMTVIAYCALDSWLPSTSQHIMGQWGSGEQAWRLSIQSATAGPAVGRIALTVSTTGSNATAYPSTAAVSFADGQGAWIKVTFDADNGASGATATYYTSTDGPSTALSSISWTQLGNPVTVAGTVSIFNAVTALEFGGTTFVNLWSSGRFFRGILQNGIDGTTVLDIDCNDITSGSTTSWVTALNQTVSVNRSTSGRKSVAVPSRHKGGRPVMLLGTDDYLEVQDNWQHGLLNFGQGDSFTVIIAHRQWNNAIDSALLAKRVISGADVSAGWYLSTGPQSGGVNPVGIRVADGTNISASVAVAATGWINGEVNVHASVVDRGSQQVGLSRNAAAPATTTARAVASSRNTNVLRVGSASPIANLYATMEFYAAAIFRRALSPAEITLLSNYFTGRIA